MQTPPPLPSTPDHTEQASKWKILRIVGICLALGPIWGLLGTVIGMIQSFGALAESGSSNPNEVAEGINVALYTTAAGLLMLPVGVILIVVSLRKLKEIENVNLTHIPPPPVLQ